MRPRDLKELLKAQLACGSNPDKELGSLMIWGPPGIGKSRIVEDTAKECEAELRDFRLLLCDPTDLRGIPVPSTDEDGKPVAVWLSPEELPRKGKGFLLFDDLPTAPPLVQGSAYQITIRPHQLGPYHLPKEWVIVAAGNRIQDRSLAHRMPAALANRFIHAELEPDLKDWREWALKHEIKPEIVAFVLWRPELLFQFNPEREEHAFPTPRSWETASRVLNHTPSGITVETLEGTVGKGAAGEFTAFLRLQTELPDVDGILDGRITQVPTRLDLKYALVCALASRGKTHHYNTLLAYSFGLSVEFAVLLFNLIGSKGAKDSAALAACPKWPEWARKHGSILRG